MDARSNILRFSMCDAYYYQDSNQYEIDLIVLSEGKLSLIEIKQGVSYRSLLRIGLIYFQNFSGS